MIIERVDVTIVGGSTVLTKFEVELPLFVQTCDSTNTLGQYPGTINGSSASEKPKPAQSKAKPTDHVRVPDTCYL